MLFFFQRHQKKKQPFVSETQRQLMIGLACMLWQKQYKNNNRNQHHKPNPSNDKGTQTSLRCYTNECSLYIYIKHDGLHHRQKQHREQPQQNTKRRHVDCILNRTHTHTLSFSQYDAGNLLSHSLFLRKVNK